MYRGTPVWYQIDHIHLYIKHQEEKKHFIWTHLGTGTAHCFCTYTPTLFQHSLSQQKNICRAFALPFKGKHHWPNQAPGTSSTVGARPFHPFTHHQFSKQYSIHTLPPPLQPTQSKCSTCRKNASSSTKYSFISSRVTHTCSCWILGHSFPKRG